MYFYLHKRRGYFYVRIRIPSDLAVHLPTSEITKALKTKDRDVARLSALPYLHGIFKTFALLRAGFITGEQARTSLDSVLQRPRNEQPLSFAPVTRQCQRCASAPQQQLVPPARRNKTEKKRRLSAVISQFISDRRYDWTVKTKQESEGSFRIIQDVLGDIDVSTIDRSVARDLRDKLALLPANMYKIYPNNTGRDLLKMIKDGKEILPMSTTSLNKHLCRFTSLMRFCVKEGYLLSDPSVGLRIKQRRRPEDERKAYTLDDLNQIVRNLPRDHEHPERFWIPVIGMFSGMRLGEICSLYVEDIKNVDGVWCFDVNSEHDKKLKTLSSIRLVPIHPALINAGLLEYARLIKESGAPRLWMNLTWREVDGYSNGLGKWYQKFNRKHISKDRRKCFHSLRHTFTDTLKQAGVQEVQIAELVGHVNENMTTGRYGKRYKPEVLRATLLKLEYGINPEMTENTKEGTS
ncbi:site-specific integrase [Geobacter sulfurreducens]|uniref:site-specific integrase n=1 Tax=Geobacter sulfurreducens TaxID=35554 RepID=UPI000DBB79A6|nr:site-specific integrase [Geobacter sulfurreducens]BBA68605.1 hypothetical protein YM18_0045 [Geobacter sulfurreducens]